MPIKSYLAHSSLNTAHQLAAHIESLPGCTVLPAENRDALIVITDTSSEDSESELRLSIEQLPSLISLTLVSAFTADDDLISISKGATTQC